MILCHLIYLFNTKIAIIKEITRDNSIVQQNDIMHNARASHDWI